MGTYRIWGAPLLYSFWRSVSRYIRWPVPHRLIETIALPCCACGGSLPKEGTHSRSTNWELSTGTEPVLPRTTPRPSSGTGFPPTRASRRRYMTWVSLTGMGAEWRRPRRNTSGGTSRLRNMALLLRSTMSGRNMSMAAADTRGISQKRRNGFASQRTKAGLLRRAHDPKAPSALYEAEVSVISTDQGSYTLTALVAMT